MRTTMELNMVGHQFSSSVFLPGKYQDEHLEKIVVPEAKRAPLMAYMHGQCPKRILNIIGQTRELYSFCGARYLCQNQKRKGKKTGSKGYKAE